MAWLAAPEKALWGGEGLLALVKNAALGGVSVGPCSPFLLPRGVLLQGGGGIYFKLVSGLLSPILEETAEQNPGA